MLVSVIMPTYNCGKYILQSLDSVIAQTVTDWEVQIVDDCSTDNTAEVLKPYLEKHPFRIKVIAYRPMGVREAYSHYQVPSKEYLEHLADILREYGFKDIIII